MPARNHVMIFSPNFMPGDSFPRRLRAIKYPPVSTNRETRTTRSSRVYCNIPGSNRHFLRVFNVRGNAKSYFARRSTRSSGKTT